MIARPVRCSNAVPSDSTTEKSLESRKGAERSGRPVRQFNKFRRCACSAFVRPSAVRSPSFTFTVSNRTENRSGGGGVGAGERGGRSRDIREYLFLVILRLNGRSRYRRHRRFRGCSIPKKCCRPTRLRVQTHRLIFVLSSQLIVLQQ